MMLSGMNKVNRNMDKEGINLLRLWRDGRKGSLNIVACVYAEVWIILLFQREEQWVEMVEWKGALGKKNQYI